MKSFHIKCFNLIFPFLLIINSSISQVPDFSKVPNVHAGDSLNITRLINNGIKVTKGKAICWFPKDSLSNNRMNEIADTLNRGIKAAEKYIAAPLPWQAHHFNEPYTFYFRLDSIISHASLAGFVSISFWRIKSARAPWLHEVLHEMLFSKTDTWYSPEITEDYARQHMPLWLFEGLPDHLSKQVSQANKLPCFDVFSNSYRLNVDSLFLEDIRSSYGSYIISHIGTRGYMPELSSKDRRKYAPGFYHGSCSFVKYIADNYGIKILLDAISSFKKEQETIETLSHKSLPVLKKEWLAMLKISE